MAELEFLLPSPLFSLEGKERETARGTEEKVWERVGRGREGEGEERKVKKTTTKIWESSSSSKACNLSVYYCGSSSANRGGVEVYVFNLTEKQILGKEIRKKKLPHLYCHILGRRKEEKEGRTTHRGEETL